MNKLLAPLAAAVLVTAPILAVATTAWSAVSGMPGHVRCVQGWNPTAAGT